jgi:hypothetical protein
LDRLGLRVPPLFGNFFRQDMHHPKDGDANNRPYDEHHPGDAIRDRVKCFAMEKRSVDGRWQRQKENRNQPDKLSRGKRAHRANLCGSLCGRVLDFGLRRDRKMSSAAFLRYGPKVLFAQSALFCFGQAALTDFITP